MPKVIVGIASGSFVNTEFAVSLADITAYLSPVYDYTGLINIQGSLIDDARNQIVKQFLLTDADYLVMFDTDLKFEINTIDNLVKMLETTGYKLGSGWYNIRVGNTKVPTIFHFLDDTTSRTNFIHEDTPEYIQADAGPSGCMIIHRSVLEAMREVDPHVFFKFENIKGMQATEDIYFCKQAKKLGFDFIVSRDTQCLHYKVQPL